MAEGDHFDQARLLAEIEEDARGSRREGIISPAFQRQLDALFRPAVTTGNVRRSRAGRDVGGGARLRKREHARGEQPGGWRCRQEGKRRLVY